jgi:hypothetical protein
MPAFRFGRSAVTKRISKGVSDMKPMLLAAWSATTLAFAAVPVQAQDWRGDSGWNGSSHHDGHAGVSRRSNRIRDRRVNDVLVTDWYGGDWAYANNRTWESDSYNDWWHEEPWRAYPHWMMNNQGCARQWYAADTLRC